MPFAFIAPAILSKVPNQDSEDEAEVEASLTGLGFRCSEVCCSTWRFMGSCKWGYKSPK